MHVENFIQRILLFFLMCVVRKMLDGWSIGLVIE